MEAATIRLFDNDAYATEFTATAISCESVTENDKTSYRLILDRTLFFPEEGGQSPDCGTINGIEVLDVQIKKDVIYHTVASYIEPGTAVSGKIDWKHRFYNMQQHSGEHIFSGIVHKTYGYNNVGFHLSNQIVTMDFDGVLTEEQAAQVEYRVNEAIAANIAVEVTYPTKEELALLDYRSKIEIEGQVRIVTILGYDVCACCAPHVHRTGEIGMLKVMTLQNYKGGVRISMLCGFRALEAFREKARVITELSGLLTCGQEMLVDNVAKQKAANQSLKSQLASAKQELMEYKLTAIPAEQKNVVVFDRGMDANAMRNAINRLVKEHEGICAFFNGSDEEGYNYIIGSRSISCKEIADEMRQSLMARGGGSDAMIQGSVNAQREDIEKTLSALA